MLRRLVGRRWATGPSQVAIGRQLLNEDAFGVMGVERRFDLPEFRKRFMELQMTFHPDKVQGETEDVKELYEKVSARCNEAYRALSDPYMRACTLLKLETGLDIHDEELQNTLSLKLPHSFLEHRMEVELTLADDPTEDSIREIAAANDADYNKSIEQLAAAFAAKDYDEVERVLLMTSYYRKKKNDIRELLPPE